MTTKIYPIVSQQEVIDLFHAILFWRWQQKNDRGLNPCHWYTTFDFVSKVLMKTNILHEHRLDTLRLNRDFFKRFLAKILVVQQQDDRPWEIVLDGEKHLPFVVKISSRELVNGSMIDPRELFALQKVFITTRGIAVGPVIERVVAKFLTHTEFEKVWGELVSIPIPGVAIAARSKRYAQWLDED